MCMYLNEIVLILSSGLVPESPLKMAKARDQKQACPIPPWFHNPISQLSVCATSHVPALARQFPALEPILLSVFRKLFSVSTKRAHYRRHASQDYQFPGQGKLNSLSHGHQGTVFLSTNGQCDVRSSCISFSELIIQSQFLTHWQPQGSAPSFFWLGQWRGSSLIRWLPCCYYFGQRFSAAKLGLPVTPAWIKA